MSIAEAIIFGSVFIGLIILLTSFLKRNYKTEDYQIISGRDENGEYYIVVSRVDHTLTFGSKYYIETGSSKSDKEQAVE